MHLTKQLDTTGCGLACIAALLEIDYQAVKNTALLVLKWPCRKRVFRTNPKQLIKILESYGLNVSLTNFKGDSLSSGTCIIGVNCDGIGNYHWIISIPTDAGGILFDPETAELYQGKEWLNVKGGYMFEKSKKRVIAIGLKVTEVKIKQAPAI